jgi:hypothetical protein
MSLSKPLVSSDHFNKAKSLVTPAVFHQMLTHVCTTFKTDVPFVCKDRPNYPLLCDERLATVSKNKKHKKKKHKARGECCYVSEA